MATINGDNKDIISGVATSVKGRFITWAGTNAAPALVVTYFLAAFDTLGNRYFWENTDASFNNAPTPVGSYVSNSLVIEGRVNLGGGNV